HGNAFVDDLDAGAFQFREVINGLVAGGFDDFDATLDDRVDVFLVGRRFDGREDGHVDAERLVGHFATAFDFVGEVLRGRLSQTGEDAETAGIGHRRGQLRATDPLHAALDDRVFRA